MRRIAGRVTRCGLGVAVGDVTPPVGIYQRAWGAATHDAAEGIHRPLTVTAAVFRPLRGDGPTLALVALDYGWFQRPEDGAELLAAVRARTGLGEAELLLNLSHTHAGANATSALTDRPGGHLIPGFLKRLTDTVSETVLAACEAVAPAWIVWGTGRCALAGNRDFWDAEAGAWACGYNPGAPADDTVLVGRATRDDGATAATFVNYACHPTTLAWGNRLLSPDYVGATREVLEQAFGAPALFLQGASGELGPVLNYANDTSTADHNGRQLGYAAAAAIEALPPPARTLAYAGIVDSGAQLGNWVYQPANEAELAGSELLAARLDYVELERKPADRPEAVEAALAVCTDGPERERLTRRALLLRSMGDAPIYRSPLWSWRLGQAALLATPHEPYSVLQQELRRAFPETPLLVLGVTNGWLGYFAPAETYGQGRYQEWQSPWTAGCLERVIGAAKRGVAEVERAG